ncbi:MAG: hypothetical protein GFH27_549325n84 [Chloroflexi bacterium AL-W]|nr:hypothetical protein [Chloroflexi bacterium AL-N1]NOK70066.1 hypothetical protein [Chloroflexi bacterium AL-N10]NOK77922.1 hypothetical protein [Chloroflexi bacterium AL-N5]NOK84931.1 hypothetical protein [Chloroflexi bacterium AL-W]NOK91910.1 hypothetical protein [Chloroflexi bacterium AL-N15]
METGVHVLLSWGVDILVLLGRLAVGLLLVFAGWVKIRSGKSRFFHTLLAYDMFPPFVARSLARILPPVEVGIGGLLILGIFTQFAAIVSLLLLLLFTGAVSIALLNHKDIPCGCFDSHKTIQQQRWIIFSRNVAAILASYFIFIQNSQFLTLDGVFFITSSYWFTTLTIICNFVL